jgi:hypothetical protein
MTTIKARNAGLGLALAVTVLTSGFSGEALAKHRRHLHVYSHASVSEANAQLASPAPVTTGQMRYYGGPKSPMWRGPVEN